ncbi:unnamed protein product [Phaedon cochleariae]|uniref:Transcription factor Adf-1 n=1 Tax=Phaedon cochleariae TaxID=80249 RepID=A0A9P0DP57_PHACE|nr:unnamed protein product [Phaedon cochleariae]
MAEVSAVGARVNSPPQKKCTTQLRARLFSQSDRYGRRDRQCGRMKISSNVEDSKLIELVRQHPCLYDPKNPQYKNLNIRDNVWENISEAMGQPVEDCRSRWRNVRDTFMRRKRNNKIVTGSGRSKKRRKWHLDGSLEFLDKVDNEKATLTNVKDDTGDSDSDEEKFSPTEDIEIEDTKLFDTEQQSQKEEPCMKNTKPTDTICDSSRKHSQERKSLSKTFERKSDDPHPIDVFFQSMAASVKSLSEERQILVKMEICQIVGKFELEEISSQSLK